MIAVNAPQSVIEKMKRSIQITINEGTERAIKAEIKKQELEDIVKKGEALKLEGMRNPLQSMAIKLESVKSDFWVVVKGACDYLGIKQSKGHEKLNELANRYNPDKDFMPLLESFYTASQKAKTCIYGFVLRDIQGVL